MTHAVFLCDKDWDIPRILHLSPDLSLAEGTGFFVLLTSTSPVPESGEKFSAVTLQLSPDGPELPALVCEYPQQRRMVIAARVETSDDGAKLNEIYARCLAWASENLQELFTDDYYQIQQMNNQLINSQRALMKSNLRLKQVLAQIQSANDTIAALEHDALTGLYRAPAFYRKVSAALKAAPDAPFDIIVLNIEHFTLVCDVFGPKTGSKVLQELALFLNTLPHADHGLFARSAKDIFYVYMPAEFQFYDLLEQQLNTFFENYPLPIRMHALLGVYSASTAEIPPVQMCDRARLALDSLQGRDDVHTAHYDHSIHETLLQEHRLLDSVPNAIQNDEFLLYLQPKVDMTTGRMIGAEALVRWQSAEFGFVSPGTFVPLLEKEGQMYQVDQVIWEKACQFLAARREKGLPLFPISVNVARGDFYQRDLPDVLKHLLDKYSLTADFIRLEIIERAYTDDTDYILDVLSTLREMGFWIEMDDFGTGASSLSMAADLPVDVLKLDRSFLNGFPENERHVEVVRFAILLARALKLELIVEGVETREQVDGLLKLGCRYAQGFFYGRPEPADRFLKPI